MAEFHAASMTVDPRNLLLHQGGLAGPQPKTSGPRARDTANLNLASSADDDNNDEVYYEWQHLSGAFSNLSNDQNEPRKRGTSPNPTSMFRLLTMTKALKKRLRMPITLRSFQIGLVVPRCSLISCLRYPLETTEDSTQVC